MKQTTYIFGLLVLLTLANFKCRSQNQIATRHEFVQQKNGNNEIAIGNYTVLATSGTEAEAKHAVQEIEKLGYNGIGFGYLSVKKLWYIYVGAGNDLEKAQATRDKYRKTDRFKEAWILTVHD